MFPLSLSHSSLHAHSLAFSLSLSLSLLSLSRSRSRSLSLSLSALPLDTTTTRAVGPSAVHAASWQRVAEIRCRRMVCTVCRSVSLMTMKFYVNPSAAHRGRSLSCPHCTLRLYNTMATPAPEPAPELERDVVVGKGEGGAAAAGLSLTLVVTTSPCRGVDRTSAR